MRDSDILDIKYNEHNDRHSKYLVFSREEAEIKGLKLSMMWRTHFVKLGFQKVDNELILEWLSQI